MTTNAGVFRQPHPGFHLGRLFRLIAMALVALIVVFGACAAIPDERARPDELPDQVRALIAQLDAETLAARSAAEKRLIELGPDILPHIPAPELLPNVSVRESVRRLRVRLERTKAERSVEASRVTLAGSFPVRCVLEQIGRQTGNRLDTAELPVEALNREVAVDFERTTFWQSIADLAAKTGLQPADSPRSPGVVLTAPAEKRDSRAVLSGPARVSTPGAALRPLFGADADRLVRVPLSVSLEPRLRPLFAHYSGRDVEAQRPDGTVIAPFTPEAKYEVPLLEGGHAFQVSLDFRTPAESAPEKVRLRGELGVLMAAGTEEFAFADLSESRRIARRRGGVTVTLLDVAHEPDEEGGQRVRVGMSVHYDVGGPAFESHRQWMFYNESFLEDARGRRIPREAGFTTRQQADGGVAVEYEFARVGGALTTWTFHYSAPTLLIDLPVKFELEDVPVKQP